MRLETARNPQMQRGNPPISCFLIAGLSFFFRHVSRGPARPVAVNCIRGK